MEIRNNTPSFGMAFRNPSKSEMSQFAKYITDDFKVSSKLVKKGLLREIDKHSKDKHFDFYFEEPKSMQVIPKSDLARQMYSNNQLTTREIKKGILSRYREKYASTAYKEAYNAAGTGKKFFMNLIRTGDTIRTRFMIALSPVEALPDNFRAASVNVLDWEKLADKQASKLEAQKQKALAKSQKMNSAIEDISSVFETKTASKKNELDVGE